MEQAKPNEVVDPKFSDDSDEGRLTELISVLSREEKIMRFFKFAHLPRPLSTISAMFADLAAKVCSLPSCAEKTVALRKLLESKDAAVRAALPPD